ncbi:condensation domain-containing protein, partial [Arthrospira platensis SPKY2]
MEQGQTPAPYLDTFPAVQRYMQQHQRDDQIYWESYLDDVEEVQLLTSLMNAHLAKSEFRSHRQVRDMRRHRLCFDQAQLNIMTESAQMHGLTLNSLFLYAWHKWLALYSGASKTVV